MIEAVIIAILVSMGLVILRAIIGPTLFDRVLAINSFGTNIVVFIALLGYVMETEFFIDIAIVYALINFITTVAFLRYIRFRNLNGEDDA